jgi:hypothetical protein
MWPFRVNGVLNKILDIRSSNGLPENLKGVCHKIFSVWTFHWPSPPKKRKSFSGYTYIHIWTPKYLWSRHNFCPQFSRKAGNFPLFNEVLSWNSPMHLTNSQLLSHSTAGRKKNLNSSHPPGVSNTRSNGLANESGPQLGTQRKNQGWRI